MRPVSPCIGQISTTLNAFSRLVDDYARLASSPNTPADKREKAQHRAQRFKEEHTSLKSMFEKQKQEVSERSRKELMGAGSSSVHVGPGGPAGSSGFGPRLRPNAPGGGPNSEFTESPFGGKSNPDPRADRALDEHTFLQKSENAIDDYLMQGKAVLDNLVDQREVLRRSKKGLRGVGETLGLSRETIGWVERRT